MDHGYVCMYKDSKYQWREVTVTEKATGIRCVSRVLNMVKDGYACALISNGSTYHQWREATQAEKITESVCDNNFSTRIINGYVCEYNVGK